MRRPRVNFIRWRFKSLTKTTRYRGDLGEGALGHATGQTLGRLTSLKIGAYLAWNGQLGAKIVEPADCIDLLIEYAKPIGAAGVPRC